MSDANGDGVAAGQAPPGWEVARMRDVAEVRLGRQRSPKNHRGSHMRPYLRAANVTWDGLDLSDIKEMNFTDEEAARYRLEPGDVLVNEASGSATEVGKPARWNGEITDCCFQNTLIRVRARDGVEPRFLEHRIRYEALRGGFARGSRGVGIHHLSATTLADWPIAVPDLDEQRRIVERLDEALSRLEAGAASLATAQRRLRRLSDAVLEAAIRGHLVPSTPSDESAGALLDRVLEKRREAWEQQARARAEREGRTLPAGWQERYPWPEEPRTKPRELPQSWVWASLGQLTSGERQSAYGVLKPGEHVNDGVAFVRVGDLRAGTVGVDNLKRIAPEAAAGYPRTTLRGGELLISLVGTIGRSALVPHALAGANCARAIAMVTLSDSIDPRFVRFAIAAPSSQIALVNQAHEVARKTLNLEDLRQFPIPLPPLEEQRRIVAEVERRTTFVDAAERTVNAAPSKANTLRRALLHAAFTGRLVPPQDLDAKRSLVPHRIPAP